jgi:hypothetical protein
VVDDPAFALAAAGRWDEAAAALEGRWPTDRASDPYGEHFAHIAAWWEQCGDELAAAEPYRRAHAAYATIASWATSGAEGSAAMVDVDRVADKLRTLSADR